VFGIEHRVPPIANRWRRQPRELALRATLRCRRMKKPARSATPHVWHAFCKDVGITPAREDEK